MICYEEEEVEQLMCHLSGRGVVPNQQHGVVEFAFRTLRITGWCRTSCPTCTLPPCSAGSCCPRGWQLRWGSLPAVPKHYEEMFLSIK